MVTHQGYGFLIIKNELLVFAPEVMQEIETRSGGLHRVWDPKGSYKTMVIFPVSPDFFCHALAQAESELWAATTRETREEWK